jgi:hypothetical protein
LHVMLKNVQRNWWLLKWATLRVRRWAVISTILHTSAWRLITFWRRRQELHVMLKLFRANDETKENRALHVLRRHTLNERLLVAAQLLQQKPSESLEAEQINRVPRAALALTKSAANTKRPTFNPHLFPKSRSAFKTWNFF